MIEEDFCYLTTTGRASGQPREIEIWFGIDGDTLYMLSGGRDKSDWVKNIRKTPDVSLRIGTQRFRGRGRIVSEQDEDALARRLLLEKYTSRYSGDLSDWGRNALPVAVELRAEP
jgi:deazaflavin-dependent oxidoreductase (nitroreductase family)